MLKTILALVMIAPFAPALAQPQPFRDIPGKSNPVQTTPADDLGNYGGEKGRHEAAIAALQAGYQAASAHRHDRAIRLFLVSLRRESIPKGLYDLGIVCAQDYRWDDALKFQREAQQQLTDPEVAKLAELEVERLQIIALLESTPAGRQHRAFDIKFLQLLKAKAPFAALDDLKTLAKQDGTRWEAPALAGLLHAEQSMYSESLKDLGDAARLAAPPSRRQQLQEAAQLARREAAFKEQKTSGDELWGKQYQPAAERYAAAWESSPGHLDVGLRAAIGFLMADDVHLAVKILCELRPAAPADMSLRISAMLRELGAVSEDAKVQTVNASDASGAPSIVDVPARIRTLVGPLTSHQMELAAKGDPPLLDDKTSIPNVPDEVLTSGLSNTPLLSTESPYDMYKRDQPATSVPPAVAEPVATPASPANAVAQPPADAKPATPSISPAASAPIVEPVRPVVEVRHGPGEVPISVSSDPPGATVTFDSQDSLHCIAPCPISLAPGRHTWLATLGNHRDAMGILTVEKGRTPLSVNAILIARLGFITVECKTSGLPLFVDGEKTVNVTPGKLTLPEGPHQVAVEIEGKMVTKEVTVRDGAYIKLIF